jgi:Tfp pilus assembly protein PilV
MPGSKFKVQGSKSRRGVTIMEVLFAIMVTAIGLMGALPLLTAAATQARKARTADASTSAVTAAVGYFDAMGMRRPQSWVAYDAPVNGNATNTGNPRYPWTEYQAFLQNPTGPQPPLRSNWFGGFNSFCIDPRMTAANQKDVTDPTLGVVVGAGSFPRNVVAGQPAMWRLGLFNGGTVPMNRLMAESLFTIHDDLDYERVADQSIVASQVIDYLPGAATIPARRRIEKHLSWMATLVPKLDRYSSVPTDGHVLSVVVFYDRPADLTITGDALNERQLAVASMPGGGIMGGEVVLQTAGSVATQKEADEQLNIHTNEWILLSGTVPHQSGGNVGVFKWYRVSDIEPEVEWPGPGNPAQRYVTLTGQDWVAFNTQAVAMQGVVAVVEKTIRLEQ